jgi:hypothetical protein
VKQLLIVISHYHGSFVQFPSGKFKIQNSKFKIQNCDSSKIDDEGKKTLELKQNKSLAKNTNIDRFQEFKYSCFYEILAILACSLKICRRL